ncbi:MAG: metallophosphoesterase [Armatimonadota bacterium]|nr:metallophosphoesterase [Armatimonadota bacterium]
MIYAIGDVHGEAEALRELLAKLPLAPSDLVIFLGDLINRGPDSFDCVEQVIAFDRCHKFFLHGNHEDAMLSFLEDGDFSALGGMEAQPTLDSYAAAGYALTPGSPASIPESHARLYAQAHPWTRPFHIIDDFIFVHAGWDLARPIGRQSSHMMYWGNVKGYEAPVWTQTVVRGHTPFPKVMFARIKQYIGVDTGCGHHGLLSAVRLPDGQTFSAPSSTFRPRWYDER